MTEETQSLAGKAQSIAGIVLELEKSDYRLGAASLYENRLKIEICQFLDNHYLSTLESFLLQSRPGSCLVLLGNPSCQQKVKKLFEKCDVSFQLVESQQGPAPGSLEQVENLLSTSEAYDSYHMKKQDLDLAKRAMSLLLKHQCEALPAGECLDLANVSVAYYPIDSFVRLDAAVFAALNVFQASEVSGVSDSQQCNLYGLLNRCRTSFGPQRLTTWLRQPLQRIEEIRERHEIVEMFIQEDQIRRSIQHNFLRRLPNYASLASKFLMAVKKPSSLSLSAVVQLYQSIKDVYGVVASLDLLLEPGGEAELGKEKPVLSEQQRPQCASAVEALSRNFVKPLRRTLRNLKQFERLVEHTVDLEEANHSKPLIRRDFSSDLHEVAKLKDSCLAKMEEHRHDVENEIAVSLGGSLKKGRRNSESQFVKITECSSLGYVFRVTKREQRVIQSDKSKFRAVRINKGEFQFTTNELVSLSNELRELSTKYDQLQADLVLSTISAASTYWPVVEELGDVIAVLDVLLAFAEAAIVAPIPYTKPRMIEDRGENGNNGSNRCIKIKRGRHPVLEAQSQLKKAEKMGISAAIVPNDVELSEETRLIVVSGPNMGGKSTFIRQVALICLMAQVGSFVPCESAELSILDSISCRVGASDDQIQGVSTYMAEMIESSTLLRASTKRSLVIIDELGRGTSTFEGFGIAWEIAKHLATEIKCFSLFATHFHELGELAKVCSGVSNFRVVVDEVSSDEGNIKFRYAVEPGCALVSYGVQVARSVGLKKEVVEEARASAAALEISGMYGDLLSKCPAQQIQFQTVLTEIREIHEALQPETRSEATKSPRSVPLNPGDSLEINDADVKSFMENCFAHSGLLLKFLQRDLGSSQFSSS